MKKEASTARVKSEDLDKKIAELEKEFTPPSAKIYWYYCLGGVLGVPLLVFLVLFFARPFFVVTRKKEGLVRDRRKLVRWTLVVTLVAYAGAYLYACRRASASSPPSFAPPVSFSPKPSF